MVVHIRQISAVSFIKTSLQIHQDWQFPVKVVKTLDSNGRAQLSTLALSRNALRNIPKRHSNLLSVGI